MIKLENFEVLTFDCYGTLIDWETGLWNSLQPILRNHQIEVSPERALESYGQLEAKIELGEYHQYKTVLKMVLAALGKELGFNPTPEELERFSLSVKDWPTFPDSPKALQALKKRYRLAIISNIDDDLFTFSAQKLGVKFDRVITAQQAKSYKPSLNNFQLAFARIGVPTNKILHVAQSLFHDIVPAQSLGLSTVWINRRLGKEGFGATPPAEVTPDLVFPDLQSLATAAGLF